MLRTCLTAALTALLTATAIAYGQGLLDGTLPCLPAPAGPDQLGWCDMQGASIGNVRNITGDQHGLDLGGGSSAQRSDVVVNFDVGRTFRVFDGERHELLEIGPGGIWTSRPVHVCHGYRTRCRTVR